MSGAPWRLPNTPYFQFDKVNNTDVMILAAIRTAKESRDASKGLKMAISAFTSVPDFRNLFDDIVAEFEATVKKLTNAGAILGPEIREMEAKTASDNIDIAASAASVLSVLTEAQKRKRGGRRKSKKSKRKFSKRKSKKKSNKRKHKKSRFARKISKRKTQRRTKRH